MLSLYVGQLLIDDGITKTSRQMTSNADRQAQPNRLPASDTVIIFKPENTLPVLNRDVFTRRSGF